ncbi:MAG: beta-ketoacyl reductase, partial [Caldilinea sp.]|nr:beta-ketoacyl reductase [Caldilinea sp.]
MCCHLAVDLCRRWRGASCLPPRGTLCCTAGEGKPGVTTSAQRQHLAALEALGATVWIAQVDVADAAGMAVLLDQIHRATHLGPLRGVIHAAGISAFHPLLTLTWAEFVQTLRPKLVGGLVLHKLVCTLKLDFFLCYSSGAGIWGGKGQADYAAANHFLDGLAAWRRQQGLPGLSIAWGPVEGEGMLDTGGQHRLAEMGVHALSPEQLLAAQSFLLETGLHQPVVAAITWSKFKPLYEASRARMLLAELADVQDRQLTVGELSTAGQATNNLAQELDALAPNQRVGWMTRMLQQAAARCMGMSHPEQIEPEQSLLVFGLDSLMAVELRNWIIQTFALTVPL